MKTMGCLVKAAALRGQLGKTDRKGKSRGKFWPSERSRFCAGMGDGAFAGRLTAPCRRELGTG